MKHNVNLNNCEGSYSYYISRDIQKIYDAYGDKKVNLEDFKNLILGITKPANETDAKRKFVLTLNSKRNKDDLVMYIANITLKAQHLGAEVDGKWANEN